MNTSRTQLDRTLDPENRSIALDTLAPRQEGGATTPADGVGVNDSNST